jgi:hypothetical protein
MRKLLKFKLRGEGIQVPPGIQHNHPCSLSDSYSSSFDCLFTWSDGKWLLPVMQFQRQSTYQQSTHKGWT